MRGYGHSLGDVVIVDVGYNEDGRGYPQGIDELMRAALAQGAKRVVWVTLRETRGVYHPANMAIRSAAKRWPQLLVADWNSYSAGKPWFRDDGLHLTPSGADGLAGFLRGYVLQGSKTRLTRQGPRPEAEALAASCPGRSVLDQDVAAGAAVEDVEARAADAARRRRRRRAACRRPRRRRGCRLLRRRRA